MLSGRPGKKFLWDGACPASSHFYMKKNIRRCNAIANNKEEEPRVNHDIRATEILLIDEENAKRGVISTKEAIAMAEAAELDLVEVAPQATPPVCRIMDYGKYRSIFSKLQFAFSMHFKSNSAQPLESLPAL